MVSYIIFVGDIPLLGVRKRELGPTSVGIQDDSSPALAAGHRPKFHASIHLSCFGC